MYVLSPEILLSLVEIALCESTLLTANKHTKNVETVTKLLQQEFTRLQLADLRSHRTTLLNRNKNQTLINWI